MLGLFGPILGLFWSVFACVLQGDLPSRGDVRKNDGFCI